MEGINHRQFCVGNLNLDVAEADSSGPPVLLLHGFPEIWYSWRYQMIALANAGFRAIAPDFRGYGLSDQPQDPENATFVDDMFSLLDALYIDQVFVVGKDFGAWIAYYVALMQPERVKGIVSLGIPYFRPGKSFGASDNDTSWILYQTLEPGRGLVDFSRFNVKSVVRNIYTLFSGSESPIAEGGNEIMDLYYPSKPLPSWFSQQDLEVYSNLYEKSGFDYPLQVPYLCIKRSWGKLEQVTEYTIKSPTLLIMGGKDYILKIPGLKEYVESESLKSDVPHLEVQYLEEGSHFVQEQFPTDVNKPLLAFLKQKK